ncbi:MAG: hypothetical protein JOZ78_26705 [Chroococcidiopsidaceae cyanobacterium CP_BM_ER_R8_30]|nr:hypothetical protein [Chroococcidiopsidaceae cyanobacterium CP_BM_ER_R8_30]
MLRAAVFVRRCGASGAGHVGWAFDYTDGTSNVGAVENTQGYPLEGPKDMAFWTVRTSEIVAPMKLRHYDEFKLIEVQHPNPTDAWQAVQWVGHHWYAFAWYNCMDSTYDVLRAFGVPDLPPPALHWLPNGWFDKILGQSYFVNEVENLRTKAEAIEPLTISPLETAPPPTWRIPTTPQWQDLQDSLAAQK